MAIATNRRTFSSTSAVVHQVPDDRLARMACLRSRLPPREQEWRHAMGIAIHWDFDACLGFGKPRRARAIGSG